MDEEDDIVTLQGENGEDIEFIEVAGIAHKGNFSRFYSPSNCSKEWTTTRRSYSKLRGTRTAKINLRLSWTTQS